MAEGERLYRKAVTIDLYYPEAFADFKAPTSAELNDPTYRVELSCTLDEATTEFTLNDPEVDDSMSFCDEAGVSNPTIDNPLVTLTIFRDADNDAVAPTDEYNIAFEHLAHPDIPYWAVLRVGPDSDTAYAIGDRVNIVGVTTDFPVDVYSTGENIRLTNNMLPSGDINWRYELVA